MSCPVSELKVHLRNNEQALERVRLSVWLQDLFHFKQNWLINPFHNRQFEIFVFKGKIRKDSVFKFT